MKRKMTSLIAVAACASLMLTGCSFVKVVKIGEEGQYTGEQTFDASAESSNDFDQIVAEIHEKAVDLADLLNGDGVSDPTPVTLTGTVEEYVSKANGKKTSLTVKVDGYDGDEEVSVQTGSIYTGTGIRDVSSLKVFEDFTNQTEWSEYAKSLNAMVDTDIIAPLDLANNDPTGKKVTLTGVAEAAATGGVLVTPVEITIE